MSHVLRGTGAPTRTGVTQELQRYKAAVDQASAQLTTFSTAIAALERQKRASEAECNRRQATIQSLLAERTTAATNAGHHHKSFYFPK